MVKALKEMIFAVVKNAVGVEPLPDGLSGHCTSLPGVLIWAIREARLRQCSKEKLQFLIMLYIFYGIIVYKFTLTA